MITSGTIPLDQAAAAAGCDVAFLRRALVAIGMREVPEVLHPGLVPLALGVEPARWHASLVDHEIARQEQEIARASAALGVRIIARPEAPIPMVSGGRL